MLKPAFELDSLHGQSVRQVYLRLRRDAMSDLILAMGATNTRFARNIRDPRRHPQFGAHCVVLENKSLQIPTIVASSPSISKLFR